ncbi:hypothetical protein T458_09765 [Brevibacillus panacihumi W25]|uniref:Uncharacterized protein n=1 Tax=Brevibacillus panacihumi W25 TaxID=1408254 RepID=V6M980_9BACL|nr:hypothetical protein [Brevibacillus panacihumi]EST55069.1 hypothetical protein T458_09765 [Brevibacillus panacihumi W25]
MNKKSLFSKIIPVTLLILSLLVVPATGAKSEVPDDVQKAAEEGIDLFKSKVSLKPELYGYKDADEVKDVTLGEGYQIHYVNGDKLKADKKGSLLDISEESDVWQFTVDDLNGQSKSFLTIALEDGEYQVVRFGGNPEVYQVSVEKFKKAKNKKPKLVKAGPTFYLVDKNSKEELVLPVVSINNPLFQGTLSNQEFTSSSKVVDVLKEIQENNQGTRGYTVK